MFPSPLWGGVRGGGREVQAQASTIAHYLSTPHPTLPHKGEGKKGRTNHGLVFLWLLHGTPPVSRWRIGRRDCVTRAPRFRPSTRGQTGSKTHRHASPFPAAAIHEGGARADQLWPRQRFDQSAPCLVTEPIDRDHGSQWHSNGDSFHNDPGRLVRRRRRRPPAFAAVERLRRRGDP